MMTVEQLIERLAKMPKDAKVYLSHPDNYISAIGFTILEPSKIK